jgi:hypothetical protein
MVGTLVAVPFVDGYWPLAGIAFLFFTGLHAYFTPLWTLMIDRVEMNAAEGCRVFERSGARSGSGMV